MRQYDITVKFRKEGLKNYLTKAPDIITAIMQVASQVANETNLIWLLDYEVVEAINVTEND